jgi:outer membrane protein OmpA-like peptidoglycan-associated protein
MTRHLSQHPIHPSFGAFTMHTHRLLAVAAATAFLAACSSLPATPVTLEQARADYAAARNDSPTVTLAAAELNLAGDALKTANDAFSHDEKLDQVTHLAYLARQRVAIARATALQKTAEVAVTQADGNRDKIRLAARTNELDVAQRNTQDAQRSAADAQRQSAQSQTQAEQAQRQSAASQQLASQTQVRNSQLEAQMKELNARETERGLVVTIGDVLFDTNQAELKPGGMRSVEKLVAFFAEYPLRNAQVEGFTDSTGSQALNQGLSGRRAEAVRQALIQLGVNSTRISAQGYGESFPVATNESLAGRQLNRRVEIVLSGDNGKIVPR